MDYFQLFNVFVIIISIIVGFYFFTKEDFVDNIYYKSMFKRNYLYDKDKWNVPNKKKKNIELI